VDLGWIIVVSCAFTGLAGHLKSKRTDKISVREQSVNLYAERSNSVTVRGGLKVFLYKARDGLRWDRGGCTPEQDLIYALSGSYPDTDPEGLRIAS
jgi:hypothetical protein